MKGWWSCTLSSLSWNQNTTKLTSATKSATKSPTATKTLKRWKATMKEKKGTVLISWDKNNKTTKDKKIKDKRFHVFKPEFYKFVSWAYWVLAASCAPLFCSYHILTQSVINHQTDRPIWNLHYLFHENVLTCYKTANRGHQMATYAANSVP